MKSHMGYWLAYLDLTLINSKAHGQGHAYLDLTLINSKAHGQGHAYLDLTLINSKAHGQDHAYFAANISKIATDKGSITIVIE